MTARVLLSCEHASHHVPPRYAHLFRGAARVLSSHRGWDPGSRELGLAFQRFLQAPLICCPTTRLLVEVNRSLGHPRLFSEYTAGLDAEARQDILARYYHSHRDRVCQAITACVEAGERAIHLSLHTFTPELNGEVRRADVGLLYDPRRPGERSLCAAWQEAIQAARPALRVRRNYPYLGKADGLTTALRRQFPDRQYAGIELEVNQSWNRSATARRKLAEQLAACLAVACGEAER